MWEAKVVAAADLTAVAADEDEDAETIYPSK